MWWPKINIYQSFCGSVIQLIWVIWLSVSHEMAVKSGQGSYLKVQMGRSASKLIYLVTGRIQFLWIANQEALFLTWLLTGGPLQFFAMLASS